MRPTPDKMSAFMALLKKKMNFKSLVITLAAIVVFTTTYLLVLPAFTLDKEEAAEQGGIDVAVEQTVETADEEAPAEQAEEPAAEQKESADAVTEAEEPAAKEEVKEETASPKQKDSDVKEEKKEDKEEVKLLSKKKELTAEKEKNDDFTISATIGKDAKVPDDVFLQATELTKDTEGFDYDKYYKDALKALKKDSDNVKGIKDIKFYDISLEAESQEESVEPKAAVNVKIEYEEGMKVDNADNVRIVHFAEQKDGKVKAEVLDNKENKVETTVNRKSEITEASFDTEGFSVFAVAETETITVPFTSGDGNTYEVQVSYGKNAGIPEGSTLEVSEITEKNTKYNYKKYVKKAAKAIGNDADEINYIRLFDIKILDAEGNKVTLDAPVDVQIRMLDGNVKEAAQVVHFADGSYEGDVIGGVEVDGESVSFETNGFSVYAVIGENEPTARMQINFHAYDENGRDKITTMYVKKEDTPDALEMIVFDPGVGKLNERETFRGWTQNATYTVEQATSSYDKDANPNGAMTIEDIRLWVREKQPNIVENPMQVYDFYPMILKHYTVTYLDRFGIAIDSNSAYMLRGEDTSAYTILMPYETNDEDYNFKGWITEDENKISSPNPAPETVTIKVESDPGTYVDKDYKLYTNNTSATISGDITFKAHAPKGKWLIFHEVEKGATYVAPQFLEENERANLPDPADMHLLGYEFKGWYTTETYEPGTEYTGAPINAKTEVYAKWEPTTWAPYTVIIWKKGLNGKYAYQESIQLYGPVGQEVQSLNSLSIEDYNDADYLQISGQDAEHHAVNKNYKTVHTTTGSSPNIVHHYNYDGTNTPSDYVGFKCARIDYTEKDDNGDSVPVVIDAAGSKVVNVYYDRIEYSVKLYVLRRNGNNYYHATYRRNPNANRPEMEINNGNNGMQWEIGVNYNASNFPSNMQWEQRGNERYSYIEVKAEYGSDISAQWPKYESLANNGNYKFTSWYTMNAAGFYKGSGSGLDSFKGIITIMDEQILGDITTANNANYLIGRYDQNIAEYTYEIWRETLEGEDYSDYETVTKEGKTYYHDTNEDIYSRSSAKPSGAHAPSYRGFDYREDLDVRPADPPNNDHYGEKYTIEFYYDRVANPIVYRDGAYFSGNDVRLNGYSNRNQDEKTEKIPYETDVSSYNKGGENYNDHYQPAYPGFVLEGWYTDDACTTPYDFNEMPDTSITVYAKWRQVQYRVFLHPQVPEDKNVYWGSTPKMCFRVDWGGKVDTPEGVLILDPSDPSAIDDSYEFVGWYRDPEYKMPFDADAFVLNGDITVPYDKDTEMTDTMNEYGVITGGGPAGNGWNSDKMYQDPKTGEWKVSDRWWITEKLDLYGKWIKKTEPGVGIKVLYDPNGGSDEVKDDTLYKPETHVTAQTGPATPPKVTIEGEEVSKVFKYWILQKWNPVGGEDGQGAFEDAEPMEFAYPGDTFVITADYARPVEETDPETGETKIIRYEVQLRAEYNDPEKETPTHIWWYSNFGNNEVVKWNDTETAQHVEQVLINEAAYIKPEDTFTRPGYTFLGWARVESTDSEGNPVPGHPKLHPELDEDDLFLKYVEAADGTPAHFEAKNSKDEWVPVTEVAADEKYAYHDLYAVWYRETQPVKVYKYETGDESKALANAVFSLTGPDGTQISLTDLSTKTDGFLVFDEEKSGDEAITIVLPVSNETYTLTETAAPAGYNKITENVIFTVTKEGVEATGAGYTVVPETKMVDGEEVPTGVYIIKVQNSTGVELPMTGGIGTTIFYILGSMLVAGCGIVLAARRRMRSEEK